MGKKRLILSTLVQLKEDIEKERENHVFEDGAYKSYKAGWNDGVQFVLDYINKNFFESKEDDWKPTILTPALTPRDQEKRNI